MPDFQMNAGSDSLQVTRELLMSDSLLANMLFNRMSLPVAAAGGWTGMVLLALGIVGALLLMSFAFFFLRYFKLWFQAYMSVADVSLVSLIRMHFTKVNPNVVVQAKVMSAQAGLNIDRETGISTRRLEAHYLAGGNVMNVIHAIIAAHRAEIPLDFDQAAAIDLAGRDVLDAVQTSVYPKVIDCPDPSRSGKTTLSAITKNGIELRVRARVTVQDEHLAADRWCDRGHDHRPSRRSDHQLDRFGRFAFHGARESRHDHAGGACHAAWMHKPLLRSSRLTSPTSTSVKTSVHVLQSDQAEADTRVARAQAERRRAEAIAEEQQMRAKVADNRSQLVLAEAEVPLAMAEAFEAGRIGSNQGS